MGSLDFVQPTVTSGNSFVVPASVATGTITSWSTYNRDVDLAKLAMKVFRPLGGATFMVVGHDGPRTLAPRLNTFTVSVPVKAGDVLGVSTPSGAGGPGCYQLVPGDRYLFHGNLADGATGDFLGGGVDRRLNVSAVVEPSNSFTLGKVRRNEKRGTASLTLDLPNPGKLTASGNGVKAAGSAVISKTVTAPGAVKLKIKAKGKKRRKLNATGTVKVKLKITYTPSGGAPRTLSRKLKLKKG